MMHRIASYGAALAALLLSAGARADATSSSRDRPTRRRASSARGAIGGAGTVVLEDVLGLSSSPAQPVLLGGVGGVGTFATAPVGISFSGAWLHASSTKGPAGPNRSLAFSTFAFAPSVDVFVTERFSLGGLVAVGMSRIRNPVFTSAGVASAVDVEQKSYRATILPRVGYAVPLGDGVSLWPRARAGLSLLQLEHVATDPLWILGASAPLVMRLGRHAVVDFGPDVAYFDTGHDDRSTSTLALSVKGGLSLVF